MVKYVYMLSMMSRKLVESCIMHITVKHRAIKMYDVITGKLKFMCPEYICMCFKKCIMNTI